MDLTQNELDQLRTAMNAELDRLIAARKPAVKQWPQVGDEHFYITVTPQSIIIERESTEKCDLLWHELGVIFKTRAEAERRVEALKVQAELRRMPGVCAPPSGHTDRICILAHNDEFNVEYFATSRSSTIAIAGVWFESLSYAYNAIRSIGQERLQIWLDDYLQTPIGGE